MLLPSPRPGTDARHAGRALESVRRAAVSDLDSPYRCCLWIGRYPPSWSADTPVPRLAVTGLRPAFPDGAAAGSLSCSWHASPLGHTAADECASFRAGGPRAGRPEGGPSYRATPIRGRCAGPQHRRGGPSSARPKVPDSPTASLTGLVGLTPDTGMGERRRPNRAAPATRAARGCRAQHAQPFAAAANRAAHRGLAVRDSWRAAHEVLAGHGVSAYRGWRGLFVVVGGSAP